MAEILLFTLQESLHTAPEPVITSVGAQGETEVHGVLQTPRVCLQHAPSMSRQLPQDEESGTEESTYFCSDQHSTPCNRGT